LSLIKIQTLIQCVSKQRNITEEGLHFRQLTGPFYLILGLNQHTRLLSRATKIIFYKTVIRPVESVWSGSMDVDEERGTSSAIFERKIFGRIYGPRYENGECKRRTNRELEEMSSGENRVKWIKVKRLSRIGHLERLEEDRMPKKIFTQELEGTRRRRRPRKGWKEEVERDLQVLGVRRWR